MLTPKLSLLESRIYDLLSGNFGNVNFCAEFSLSDFNLTVKGLVVVIVYKDDKVEGEIISPSILHPCYTLRVISQSYLEVRKLMEELVEYFDGISALDFRAEDWAVTHYYKESQSAPEFQNEDRYFMGMIDYRFHLTSSIG